MKEKFYQKTWFIVLMLLCCCFPLGLFLMWKYKKFNKPVRIVITVLFVLAFIGGIFSRGTKSMEDTSESLNNMTSTETATTVETTTMEETSTLAETTIEETTTAPTISEEDFKSSCQNISYKTILRNPDEYIGQNIVITAKIQQIMQGGFFDDGQYYRLQTDNDGYELYLDDEYFMYDGRISDTTKLLQDDIIVVYGEFVGIEKVKRVITKTTDEIPAVKAYYVDIISE